MPSPRVPRLDKWVQALREAVGELDKNTTLVGYSLGTPTTLRFLADYPKNVKIAGLVLVAGFGDGIFEKPGALFDPPLDFDRIAARAKTRVAIYSDKDRFVSPKISQQLAWRLGAREVIVVGGGHFMGRNLFPGSIDRLPAALEAVLGCYPPRWERWIGDMWRSAYRRLLTL